MHTLWPRRAREGTGGQGLGGGEGWKISYSQIALCVLEDIECPYSSHCIGLAGRRPSYGGCGHHGRRLQRCSQGNY